jgi:hypothetical protein
MSEIMEVIPFATSATSNKLGLVGGPSEYPVTLDPMLCNHKDSQLPLKPV